VLKSRLRDEALIASHTKSLGAADEPGLMRAADFSAAESKNVSRKPTNHHTPPYMHKGSLNDCFNYYCARSITTTMRRALLVFSSPPQPTARSLAPMKALGIF
jgi:hypothetical protein